ncbi:hypothetical protein GCM10009581_17400 [Tsukamurella strandjordii]
MRGDPQRQPDLCRDTGLPPVLRDTGSDPLRHPHPQQLRDQPILIEDHPRTSPLQPGKTRNHTTADITAIPCGGNRIRLPHPYPNTTTTHRQVFITANPPTANIAAHLGLPRDDPELSRPDPGE